MKWNRVGIDKDSVFEDERILVSSPCYPENHEMRFRVINGQFLHLCEEVTHWALLESNKPKEW